MINYMPISSLNQKIVYNSIYFICILYLRKTHIIIFFKFSSELPPYKRNLQLTHENYEIGIMATIPQSDKNKRTIQRSNQKNQNFKTS